MGPYPSVRLVGDGNQSFKSQSGSTAVKRFRGDPHAVAKGLGLADDHQRGRGIGERDVAIGVAGTGENVAKCSGVGNAVTAPELVKSRMRKSEIGGRQLEGADFAIFEGGNRGGASGGDLVKAVAVHDPYALSLKVA